MENVVSFEVAKLLDNYNIPLYWGIQYYNYKGELDGDAIDEIKELVSSKQEKREFNENYKSIPAFKQSYIQKVLREKYNIHIEIIGFVSGDLEVSYSYWIRNLKKYSDVIVDETNYDSYEKCLEEGLKVALQMI